MRTSYATLGAIAWSLAAADAAYAQDSQLSGEAPEETCPASSSGDASLEDELTEFIDNPACNAALYDFNYGEPGSPVLPLVGVQADQITRVESVRRFGLALLTGLESDGVGPAMGIDFSPFWLLARGRVTLHQYRREFSDLERIFARTKVSAAVGRGDEANAIPSSMVFSLSSRLASGQDPLMRNTFNNCVNTRAEPRTLASLLDDVLDAGGLASDQSDDDEAEADFDRAAEARMAELKPAIDAAYQACADELALDLARRSSFDVGAGFRLTGDAGHFRNLEGSGAIVWGTYATGVLGGDANGNDPFWGSIGMQVRGVIHARYTFSEDIFDENGVRTGEADSALLVAGLESVPVANRPDNFRWSLQAGWNRQDAPNAESEDRNYWRFLGLARLRIREGLWLNATVGRVQGRGVEEDTYVSIGVSIAPATGSAGIDNFYRRPRN